ncbi:MAG: membrane protein insertase YidC [Epsilonproteobacteria bacterium]|nr:membrane protein insertase YidC [Campylobacterota bacterium]
MEQQQDLQKRLLLALVLSFAVFILFNMFSQKAPNIDNNSTKTQVAQQTPNSISTQTPNVTKQPSSASSVSTSAGDAPVTNIESIATVKSDRFVYSIDKAGRIAQVKLLEDKYKYNGKPLELFNPKWVKPLEIRFTNEAFTKEAQQTPYSADNANVTLDQDGEKLVLIQKLSFTTITKVITFYKDGHYDLDIKLSKPEPYFITTGQRPDADHTRYMVVHGAMVRNSNGTTKIIEDGDAEGVQSFPNAKFTASFDRYYTSILYDFKNLLNVSYVTIGDGNPLMFVEGRTPSMTLHGYIGPKEYNILHSIEPELTEAIEYGWFTFLSKPLFKVLHWLDNHIGNWGWSIIILTLLIKLLLFPLSYKGMMSMQKLKDLSPKMKEIKERYKGDSQKMNMKMMELYKKHGANPMGGCLPMLLQIPVFFALYRVFLNAVELQGAPWILWIRDLSQQDPYFVLPILMGASMWFQQKITPNTMTDPMQQKIFQWLPVVMTMFFLTFPAGLVLYWLVNNIFTIAQQYVINRAYEKHKAAQKIENKK